MNLDTLSGKRRRAKISQTMLAAKIGTTTQTIVAIELMQIEVTEAQLQKMSDALDALIAEQEAREGAEQKEVAAA